MTETRPLAIVTGGSSGIGYELAKQFAEHRYDVAISGQSERVFASADKLRKLGVEAYPHQSDASTYDVVESFWTFITDLDRPVDVAVLNVGIGLGGAFVDNDLDEELRLIAINVTGTVHFAKRVVQQMVPRARPYSDCLVGVGNHTNPVRDGVRPVQGLRILLRRVTTRRVA